VRSVADGSHVLPDELTSSLFVQIAADGIVLDGDEPDSKVIANVTIALTLREKEIVALIGEGLGNKEIAARLCITSHTVKTHVRNAMEKTGLHTRVLLAVSANRARVS
jgi:DNA-binding NarL/FixJ family response regulator